MKPSTYGFLLGLGLLATALWALDAQAGTITMNFGAPQTLTTTTNQDAKLAKLLADDNAQRATQGLPARTMEGYLFDVLTDAIKSYLAEVDRRDATAACVKYKTLSGAARTQIDTALLASPCP